jgi:hypothetical protein
MIHAHQTVPGLGHMRRHRKAAFLGDRDERTKMAQLQALPHACEVWRQAYKVSFRHAMSAQILDHVSDGKPLR